jgi:hypothetical protein
MRKSLDRLMFMRLALFADRNANFGTGCEFNFGNSSRNAIERLFR